MLVSHRLSVPFELAYMLFMKQVVCINWGTAYGARYINRLYAMVARNITPPFRFIAFTDNADGVRDEVECFDLPPMPAPWPKKSPGQWGKSRLWAADLGGLTGNFLFLDLDVIVTDSLDPFFDYGDPDQVIMGLNVARFPRRMGQSSIYRAPVGKLAPLQAIFAADPQGVADEYRYEQFFVEKNAPGGVLFWPRKWMRHFRIECIPKFPFNYFRPPALPQGTRVVIFAGGPNPPEAIIGKMNANEPLMGPGAFFCDRISKGKGLRALQNYGLPAPWIEEHWTE